MIFLIFITLLNSSSVKADSKKINCLNESGDIEVRINTFKDKEGSFEVIVENESKVHFWIPKSPLIYSNPWGGSDRIYFNYHPGWGESTVHVYGRISIEGESLFDIYTKGMVGDFVRELSGMSCSIKN